MILNLL